MTEEQFNKRYDVFHSKLVANAGYDGYFEMPKIRTSNQIPNNVILFSRAVSEKCKDFDCWVIFYEHDCNFIRLWNDDRTFDFCFDGIEKNSTVSIGTHGCIGNKTDRTYFKNGLAKMVEVLAPKNIIVYGRTPDDIFAEYKNHGIDIIAFESELAKSRKQVTA